MAPSWWQILIVLVLFVLLFGRGKISELMGDMAKGIKSFKKGMAEDETDEHRTIDHDATEPMTAKSAEEKTKAS
jgi:sec-independent protein translocase protein TatA